MFKKVSVIVIAVGLLMTLTIPSAIAADFPAKDITMICPWSAGGGTDTLARALVKNAKQYFGVNVNVVNKTGGMGAVGMGGWRQRQSRWVYGNDDYHPIEHLSFDGIGGPFLPGLRLAHVAEPECWSYRCEG